MPGQYIQRFADETLTRALKRAGAVLIEGPKGCGKTETALQVAQSQVRLDVDPQVAQTVEIDPSLLLLGEQPRLLDEWQLHPVMWDVVRRDIDDRKLTGGYILTGSTAPGETAARHTGAGRFARLQMSTMSLAESGESTRQVSLGQLLEGQAPRAAAPDVSISELVDRMCRGGWPAFIHLPLDAALENLRDYVSTVADVDIRTPDGVRRDPAQVRRLLRSLGRGVGTELKFSTLAQDAGINRDTATDYIAALSRIFIQVEQPAWSAHLRSKATLRNSPKRHMADPALAVAALGATPQKVLQDLDFAGQLFESQVVHDLAVLMGGQGTVAHARDSAGKEVDAVLERHDGRWALVEIKLGSREETVEKAAASLKAFRDQLELEKYEYAPELIVLTGGGLSYRRPDGVNVVAFTALTR
ncbi:MAG: DUF4143 domain-containing protein [Rothia sp. (in: high G+C Gram-positive bacteria)]|nr:DUF4143 domain-containing protein [Rothia sp. (in: high G+C Gram-positive bacteria)]